MSSSAGCLSLFGWLRLRRETVSPDRPQLFTQYTGVEIIAYYRKGGFHPIHIDDILQNRYRIVNKLGHGAYSTIWLVEDLNSGKYAAPKVLAAEVSKDSPPEVKSEVAILRYLKQRQLPVNADASGGSDGQEFLLEFFDDFKVEGPDGTHQCIVAEVLGPSMMLMKFTTRNGTR
jgi:serine/threonine protein kinase